MKFLLLIVILFSPAGIIRAEENSSSLKVLCWNIHHGRGADGNVNLERIAAVIREHAPDIVMLQEVDKNCKRTGRIDQPAELARLTGMKQVFGKESRFGEKDLKIIGESLRFVIHHLSLPSEYELVHPTISPFGSQFLWPSSALKL